jgi:hypothetical protein
VLTSRPPQLSSIADVVSQDTQDLLVTSPLRHTKPVAHALTQKTCIANQNEICPKPALEDTGDSSISSTQGSYLHDHATHPMKYSLIDLTNLTLNCGKNPSRRLLQIFVMNLLLFFITHSLAKLISFSSNVIKKFLMAFECLPIAPSCMLLRFNTKNHHQWRRPHIQMTN